MKNDDLMSSVRFVYGESSAAEIVIQIEELLASWKGRLEDGRTGKAGRLSQRGGKAGPGAEAGTMPVDEGDAIMICYGDSIGETGRNPLGTLADFARRYLDGVVSGIHILPFSPYSSDDGFSVIDYRQVNPELGDWDDVMSIGRGFRLMADLVLNHCSRENPWFGGFCDGDERFRDYFIAVEEGVDLSAVFRPRALPLLHPFVVKGERRMIWTTFSEDQVDLNFANPRVLLEFLDILLGYVWHGVGMIRLDAIGFLWKELGTACIHHPKTHEVVKLFRKVLSRVAPEVIMITETNVPHRDNVAYFGNGHDEAHMVYQFPLPPLTLDAFMREDAGILTGWARGLDATGRGHCFFNFLASHDGIGMLPTYGILSDVQREAMVEKVKARGGLVSYKDTGKGTIPYELNISYLDAVAEGDLPVEERSRKFLCSQAVMLVLAGVPGIYVHSLLGSRNWLEGVRRTGMNRSINREKLSLSELEAELADGSSLRGRVFSGYRRMLNVRAAHAAFHPAAAQLVIELGGGVFAVMRGDEGTGRVFCLQSVSSSAQSVDLHGVAEGSLGDVDGEWQNLLDSRGVCVENGSLLMEPWEVLWLVRI